MRAWTIFLLVAPLGAQALAAGRLSPRPSAAFDLPPYSVVSNGLAPSFRTLPESLPKLAAGSLAGFHVCAAGGTNFLFCGLPLLLPVNVASQDFAIAREAVRGVLPVASDSAQILFKRETGGVAVASERSTLITVRQQGAVCTAQAVQLLDRTNLQMSIVSAQASQSLLREDVQQSMPSVVQVVQAPEVERHAGDVASAVVTQSPMTLAAEVAATPLVGESASEVMTGARAGGRLGSLLDADGVLALADSAIVQLLVDQSLIDGIYDAENILMAPTLQVPAEESALFLGMMSRRPPLDALLNRPCSAGFRAQVATNAAAECRAELSLAIVGAELCHHGGSILLSLELKNTGDSPLHDALILNRLPEHTTFLRFLVANPLERGFVHACVPELSLLVWKLYSPLQAGQTFKATVLLKLDEWRVPVKGGRFRSMALSRMP